MILIELHEEWLRFAGKRWMILVPIEENKDWTFGVEARKDRQRKRFAVNKLRI
jgi:ribosomal protein L14E/L6E/L27E